MLRRHARQEEENGGIGLIENSSRRSWVYPMETVELTGDRGWASIDNVVYLRLCEAIRDSNGQTVYLDG